MDRLRLPLSSHDHLSVVSKYVDFKHDCNQHQTNSAYCQHIHIESVRPRCYKLTTQVRSTTAPAGSRPNPEMYGLRTHQTLHVAGCRAFVDCKAELQLLLLLLTAGEIATDQR